MRSLWTAGWLTAVLVAVAVSGAAAKGGKPSFGADIVLPGGQGGEPSIATDTTSGASRGTVYVGAIGDANGPLEWHSYDGGVTWSQPVPST
jgi:hypothetical protein